VKRKLLLLIQDTYEKKKTLDKNLVNSRGPALVFWWNPIPTKRKITRRNLQNICFSLAGFPTTPSFFFLESQSLSWTKQKNKNTPFFGFTI